MLSTATLDISSSIENINSTAVFPDYLSVPYVYDNTHTGKTLVGIFPTGMQLMFSEYILAQYLTLMSQRKISCD